MPVSAWDTPPISGLSEHQLRRPQTSHHLRPVQVCPRTLMLQFCPYSSAQGCPDFMNPFSHTSAKSRRHDLGHNISGACSPSPYTHLIQVYFRVEVRPIEIGRVQRVRPRGASRRLPLWEAVVKLQHSVRLPPTLWSLRLGSFRGVPRSRPWARRSGCRRHGSKCSSQAWGRAGDREEALPGAIKLLLKRGSPSGETSPCSLESFETRVPPHVFSPSSEVPGEPWVPPQLLRWKNWLGRCLPGRRTSRGFHPMSLDAVEGARASGARKRVSGILPLPCWGERGRAAAHFPSFLISGYMFHKGTVRIKCIYSHLENPMEPDGLQSVESQRHDVGTKGQPQCLKRSVSPGLVLWRASE